MAEHKKAEEVRQIASHLIRTKHTRLEGVKIVYMYHPTTWTQGGKTVIYRVTKVSSKIKEALELEGYTEIDFLVEFAENAFLKLTPRIKEAAVDEALCKMGKNENGDLATYPYDFRGYLSNLRDYGAWSAELQQVEMGIRQTSLFDAVEAAEAIIDAMEAPPEPGSILDEANEILQEYEDPDKNEQWHDRG